MSDSSKDPRTQAPSREQYEDLQRRLEEAEHTLEALRHGDVDALVVIGPQGEQVYSLTGAEHVYRVIVETMNEAALTVDLDGTILFCNQRFCDLMKTPIYEAMGRKMAAFVGQPQERSLRLLLADARTGPVQRRLLLRAADGRVVPVQLAASPLHAGESLSICLVASDLTELEESANSLRVLREHEQAVQEANERLQAQSEELQRQTEELRQQTEELADAEATLRETRDYLDSLFRYANAPIVVWDRQFRITRFNHAFERLTGHRADDVLGRRIDLLFPADSRAESLAHLRSTSEGQRWEVIEIPILCTDGTVKTVLWNSANVLSPDRQTVVATIAQGQDITERKQAEESLRELNATLESKVAQRTAELAYRANQLQKLTLELTQAEEQERRRIAVILHEDLQQQMAGAKFHLNLVKGRIQDARLHAEIEEVSDMLKETIERSRNLSRDLSPAVVNMNDLAEVLRWLVSQLRAQHGLNVNLDVSGDMMLQSEALAMFLFRAAQEMLFNIVKHAHVPEAAIRIKRLGRYVRLSVSDQGRGFDPQELKEAPGVGLFSIRERTELLCGRMKVKSAKGKGSKLSITVPDGLKAKSPEQTPEDVSRVPAMVPSLPSNGVLRVLLVDDHDLVRQGLAALLKEAPDIELVGEAADGREAINKAIDLRPDVVIMDVSMPIMSGAQATRHIKRHLPQTRVIALSMYDEADKKEEMFQAGAESYMLKTASTEELLAAIRGHAQAAVE